MPVGEVQYVVPPGQEVVTQRMVNPEVGLPAGWTFVAAKVIGSEVRALYRHPLNGATARLSLFHPDTAPSQNGRRSEKFAVFLQASEKVDSLGDLFARLDASIREHEPEFSWQRVEAVASKRSAPPAPRRPRAPATTDAATTPSPSPTSPVAVAAPVPPGASAEASRVDIAAIEREINEHLELVPYIDLDVRFDHRACFAEAEALLDRYVRYQSDPTYGISAWRSLALRSLDGVASGSAQPEGDAANDESRYRLTDVAALCPKTMAFLDEIVDVARCRVITYLSLEPGGRIQVHVDDTRNVVMRSINIALNMPPGCDFAIETNPDGSSNPYTRLAPITEGKTLLMNVARFHWVENRSTVRRIHLNARGPLKLSPERILELARRQNGIADREQLLAALADKNRDPAALCGPAEVSEPAWRARLATLPPTPPSTQTVAGQPHSAR